jgi:hypothetical protein
MKPGLERILGRAAETLNSELVPQLEGPAVGHASMIRWLMTASGQAAEREPDILVAEIAAMRRLFEDAADTTLPGDLCEQLRGAVEGSQPTSYSVSALTDLCNGMKAVLISLQIELEDISAPWARRLEAQVWDVLRMGVDRRQVSLRGF